MYSNYTASARIAKQAGNPGSGVSLDPYNYAHGDELHRNSMINRLPGKRDVHMGEIPQVVILLQAAEIERLSHVVSSQRQLSKGISKENLDRHSYQTQIKQLTQVIETQKEENRGLGKRLQEMNKKLSETESMIDMSRDSSALANKYERALLQIGKMYDDNTKLQDQINQLTLQLAELNSQKGNLEVKETLVEIKSSEASEIVRLQERISELEYENSKTVTDLRQSFGRQLDQYKARVEQKGALRKGQSQQQLAKALQRINSQAEQIRKQEAVTWEMESRIRHYEIRLKEQETRLRSSGEQINRLGQKIIALEGAALLNSGGINGANSLSYSYSLSQPNRNSVLREQSVNSSYYPEAGRNQIGMRSNEQLENNVALLSQELERLSELIKSKSKQIEDLQSRSLTEKAAHERQLIQIRMKYEGDLRKEAEKCQQERQRCSREMEKYRTKVRQLQQGQWERAQSLDAQLLKIKQEERKICEAVHHQKVELLRQEYERDREQIRRLNNMVGQMRGDLDSLTTNQQQLQSQKSLQKMKHVRQLEEVQSRYEARLKAMEYEMRREADRRVQELDHRNREDYDKLIRQAQQQAELLRQRELDNMERVKDVAQQYENNVKLIEREKERQMEVRLREREDVQRSLSEKLRQKDRQLEEIMATLARKETEEGLLRNNLKESQREISRLNDQVQIMGNENSELAGKTYQSLQRKLDYLGEETVNAKISIMESLEKNPSLNGGELGRINSNLQYLASQMGSISKQILDYHLKAIERQSSGGSQYQSNYVKQLQAQCDNYLEIINGKMSNSDSALKRIWDEIESNNRHNREEQERWRQALAKHHQLQQQLWQEKEKWEAARLDSEKMKHSNRILEMTIEQLQEQHEKVQAQVLQLESTSKNMSIQYKVRIEELEKQLMSKQQVLREYSVKLSAQNEGQGEEISRMTQIIQMKSKELLELSGVVGQYEDRYNGLRDQFRAMEQVVGKVLQDRQNDFHCIDKLETENSSLKRELKKAGQQLQLEKNEKDRIVEASRDHLSKLTQQLLSEVSSPFVASEDFGQTTKLISLQADFGRLEQVIRRLKKDNFLLVRKNYDGEAQDHVDKEFAHRKMVQLNKEIERLIQLNIQLKDELERLRLQFVGQVNSEVRYEQNLGLMVLLFVEVEALRTKLKHQASPPLY